MSELLSGVTCRTSFMAATFEPEGSDASRKTPPSIARSRGRDLLFVPEVDFLLLDSKASLSGRRLGA